jgi:hypothetical protein
MALGIVLLAAASSFGQAVRTLSTTYDRGDSVAALGDRFFVAEDNGGRVDVYSISQRVRVGQVSTGYDRGGDRIAVGPGTAAGLRLFVAEDDGGWVDVLEENQGWAMSQRFRTSFDRRDGLAAANNLVFVAEDDGGLVEVYDVSQGGALVGQFSTSYDRGDDVAAASFLFLVAEDDGGLVEVYNSVREWRKMGQLNTGYDRRDGLAAYILGYDGGLLVVCVAEDDGGQVECSEHKLDQFIY